MPIPNNIKDISVTPTSNSPLGSDNIGTSLDEYLRSIQAVVRQESINKSWERRNDTPTYINATTFTLVGNLTAFYTVDRAIKAIDSSIITGLITSSVFASGVTTVVTAWNSGNLTASLSEVQLGIETTAVKPSLISSAMQPIVNAVDVSTARNLFGVNTQYVGDVNFSGGGTIPITLPFPLAYIPGTRIICRVSGSNIGGFNIQPTGQSVGAVNKIRYGVTTSIAANDLVSNQICSFIADGTSGWILENPSNPEGLLPANNLSDLGSLATALVNLGFTNGSGWLKLPTGHIIQWGTTGAIPNGSTTVHNFPIVFPIACDVLIAQGVTNFNGAWEVATLSNSQALIRNLQNTTSAFRFLTLGR